MVDFHIVNIQSTHSPQIQQFKVIVKVQSYSYNPNKAIQYRDDLLGHLRILSKDHVNSRKGDPSRSAHHKYIQIYGLSHATRTLTINEKSPPWLCFSTCQEESLTKQWTYGPTLLPWFHWFDHFHTSLACFSRAVKQARDVWKWSNHGNSVGP